MSHDDSANFQLEPDAGPASEQPLTAVGVGSTGGSAWMSEREHDLMIALRQLCDATRKQAAAVKGESIMVRMKRLAAEKLLARHETASPNVQDEPRRERRTKI